ncbi:hypothetical protein GQX74_006342 [Glossina fuscipes]|nr:hypothetical protein GQX74_006342 [Glossina fuscipes]
MGFIKLSVRRLCRLSTIETVVYILTTSLGC